MPRSFAIVFHVFDLIGVCPFYSGYGRELVSSIVSKKTGYRPTMNKEDPFHTVHADVVSLLTTTRPLLTSYLRIRSTTPSATSPELLDSRRDLESALQDLSADLHDLIDSVNAAEGDPYRYGLQVEEVSRRRRLVQEVGEEMEGMRREVNQTVAGSKGKGKSRAGDLPDPDAFEDERGEDGEGDGYEAFERERQQELLQEQDTALDGVFRTVGNLRRQADDMGKELEEQGEILDDVDVLADRIGGKLENGIKRIGWVIKKNEGKL